MAIIVSGHFAHCARHRHIFGWAP